MKKTQEKSASIVHTLRDYLKEHHEEGILHDVVKQLNEIVAVSHDATEIIITSAVPLTQNEQFQLQRMLNHVVGRDLPSVNQVNPSLIGGFTIRIRDWFLDASIANHIRDMKRRLLA